ncbi:MULTISPECIES: 50S ribosomal protein L7/L12 [Spirulina sp. CCY15215]|uniref:50S ribosomal protein L7/L12 n=1 Tax=Spirulina sp. CCY15215 TaxID=2767591 RepID=UPI00195098CB|nr:50S ribosomal protein L7/L12 [Spirulina major]
MSVKVMTIIEQMKTLTLVEAAELIKQIEKNFGVDASPMKVKFVSLIHQEITAKPDDFTMVDVVLETAPKNKKAAITRAVWNVTGLGLKNAKTLVNSTPSIVKQAVTPEDGLKIKANLESFGAIISLK